MSEKLRIAFMGTPDFAAVALEELLNGPHEVVCAYSQPPRPKGRGHKVQKSPVHMLAEAHDVPVFTPHSLKSQEAQDQFAAQRADVAVVAAYGLLLPEGILKAPKYGCLNIHGSLLPRWRGASPIQRAIWAGDEKSGVTIMQMDKGLDTGPMIAKSELSLTQNMTASMLHDALARMGAQLIGDVLDTLAREGSVTSEAQEEAQATYAPMLKKSDGQVTWSDTAQQIDRQIRALNPWPGVWAHIQGARFKIHNAVWAQEQNASEATPGTVLDKDGHIACGEGSVLRIISLQPEGKKAMDFSSALNGGYIDVDAK